MELFKLFGTIAITNAEANDAIDDTTDKAEQSESKIGEAFKKIGAAVATYFAVDKIKEFGLSCINAAADADATSAQFSQVFGDLESQASKSLSGIADSAGITENRMKGSYTKIAAFAKTTGMDTESALGLADRAMVAVADSAAFYDRSLEETTESLQSFLKGNYENDAALGLSCTETTRNAVANKLYGQSFSDLSESQKQLALLQMVEDANAASGALGQAARESDTWTNQTGNLQQAWTDFKALIGSNFLPIAVDVIKKLSEGVQSVSEKVPEMVAWFEKYKGAIAVVAAVVGILTTAVALQNTVQAIKAAMNAAETTSLTGLIAAKLADAAATMAALAPYVLIVAAIAAVIAVVVLLVKHWDDVKAKCTELWEKLKEIWENIKNSISEKVEEIKTSLLEKWNAIKETIATTIDNIKSSISEKFETAKQTIIDIFTAVRDTLSSIWETVKNVIQVAIMFIAEIFITAFELITLPWRFVWENCKEYIIDAWETIKLAVSTALDFIKTIISDIWNGIVAFLSPILESIKTTAINIWNAISSGITSAVNTIKAIITTIWNAISSFILTAMNTIGTTISNIWNSIKNTISSVINAIKSVISSVFNTIKTTITSILNSIKAVFSSIWNSIKSTVSSVINTVKSAISSGLQAAFSTVSNVLGNIKSKFSSIFEGVKSIVSGAIEKIKGFFDFSWELPNIKLPHFSIDGKFSLNPPSIPTFNISWYKKAMDEPYMFTKPTLFDLNPITGKIRGAGEAGDEVMIGKETMLNMIRAAVSEQNSDFAYYLQKLISMLADYLPQLLAAGERDVVLYPDAVVGRLAYPMNRKLAEIREKEGRGR